MNIADTTILVTGANRGIGQALVTEALARGASRVYAGTRGTLDHRDPRVTPVALDVTDAAQVQAVAQRIGALDIPKVSAQSVARAILDGVEREEEDIFPDPLSASVADSWRNGATKALERQLAASAAA
jgi:NAD(P)-dependent dehydrogenase (short-subunit alcohol dehydrogenase family)